jgi:hypothetical protein
VKKQRNFHNSNLNLSETPLFLEREGNLEYQRTHPTIFHNRKLIVILMCVQHQATVKLSQLIGEKDHERNLPEHLTIPWHSTFNVSKHTSHVRCIKAALHMHISCFYVHI